MSSIYVPEPVISLAIAPANGRMDTNFQRALTRFTKEDPTFRVHLDKNTRETIISGMGELHLNIYVERMKREYFLETICGAPRVNYKETFTRKAPFLYTHKKQSGGAGQFAKLEGFVEPLLKEDIEVDDEEETEDVGHSKC